jgi:hypothetical protein
VTGGSSADPGLATGKEGGAMPTDIDSRVEALKDQLLSPLSKEEVALIEKKIEVLRKQQQPSKD